MNAEPRSANPVRAAIAVLTPLLGVAIAYVLLWVSDRLLYIGPLDRAKFGWLVVVPIWSLTPVAAALAWRPLDSRQSAAISGVTGLILSAASAVLVWLGNAFTNCQYGAVRTPAEWIGPSVAVGLVIGGGFAITCLITTVLMRRRPGWVAAVVGAGTAFALIFAALLVFTMIIGLGSGTCQRPPLN
jgi:hypothetical protein